jgi:cell division protein FtsB
MEFKHKLALFTPAAALGLGAAICVGMGSVILSSEETRAGREIKAAQAAHAELEAERFAALEAETRLLAGVAQLKAVLGTHDSATIGDALKGFRELMHADFLDAFDEKDRSYYDANGNAALEPLVAQVRETGKPQFGYVSDGDQLRQAVAVPVNIGNRGVGTLVAGFNFDEDFLTRLRSMTQVDYAISRADAEKTLSGAYPHGSTAVVGLESASGHQVARLLMARTEDDGVALTRRLRPAVVALSVLAFFFAFWAGVALAGEISRRRRRVADVERELEELAARAQALETELATLHENNGKLVTANQRLLALLSKAAA